VLLEYYNKNERIEKSLHPLPSIPFEMIESHLNVDILVINMISGWELSLEVLKKIRTKFKKTIIMDFHSLSLGRKDDGIRFYNPVPQYREWFLQCDIIQMNEVEFNNLGGQISDINYFVNKNMYDMQLVLNITRGNKGSLTIIRNHHYFELLRTASDAKIEVIDPTGCGDAFLGAFTMYYANSTDVNRAVQKANILAAIAGTNIGFASPDYLEKQMQNYQDVV
jgi:sugar/nucleoside kinase (ribokinase family)